MSTSFVDVCRFTAASSGTGNFVVSAAVTGYQSPAAAEAVDGAIYSYRAESSDLSEWEVGYGAYTAGSTTLARTTITANSSGGTSAINFSAAPQVSIVALAADLIRPNSISNGKITESRAANAATFALKTLAGADPSPSDPVTVCFGDGTVIAQTAALSVVVSSGSTLGATSAIPFRIWFALTNDSGTLRLAVRNCRDANGIYGFPAHGVLSSTAEGGAGAADSAGVTYTGTAVTAKQFVIAAFADYESGLTTAGTWDAAPTRIQAFQLGMKLPGDVIQSKTGSDSTGTSNSTTSWVASGVDVVMTPTSPCNPIVIDFTGMASMANPTGFGYVGVLRSGNLIGFDLILGGGTASQFQWNVRHTAVDFPGSTSSLTWAVGVKAFTGGVAVIYPSTAAASDSGTITATELMG